MARKIKKRKPLGYLSGAAVGLGGLGVGLGVGAAVAGKASAGTAAAGIMPAFGTVASGAGIATTAVVGKGLLGQVRQLNKGKKKKGMRY